MNARIFALFAALAATGCSPEAPPQRPPLEGARIGGPFALTDQDGKAVTDASFAGKYRIVYFGYSYCPDVCPVDLQKIAAGFAIAMVAGLVIANTFAVLLAQRMLLAGKGQGLYLALPTMATANAMFGRARRVVRMAAEDIGLADPQALRLCIAARDTVEFLGSPEGDLALAQAELVVSALDAAVRANARRLAKG